MDDFEQYCDRPVRKKDGVTLNSNNIPWPHNNESDDSDNEDVLPVGEFWPIPEEEWTVVKRPQKKPRGNHGSDRGRTEPRITEMLPDIQTEKETVTVKVKPIVEKEPEGIGAVLIDIADGRDNCSVNVVVSPQGREHQKMGIRTKTEELFSDGLKVIPNKMAEKASTGTLTEIREVITRTTATNATMKGELIIKSIPHQIMVEVLEESKTDENTI